MVNKNITIRLESLDINNTIQIFILDEVQI